MHRRIGRYGRSERGKSSTTSLSKTRHLLGCGTAHCLHERNCDSGTSELEGSIGLQAEKLGFKNRRFLALKNLLNLKSPV